MNMGWSLLYKPSAAGQTFSERLSAIKKVIEKYHAEGIMQAGSVLPGRVRLGIAHAARHAVFGCQCSEGGIDGDEELMGFDHEVCPALLQSLEGIGAGVVVANTTAKTITDLVHPMINCQHLLSKELYLDIIQRLGKSGIVPMEHDGLKRQYFLQTLYNEIIMVAGMVHSMYVFCLIAPGYDYDPPKLPDIPNSSADDQPYWFDWTKVIKPNKRGLSHHDGLWKMLFGDCFAPYLPRFAIDPGSPEFFKIIQQNNKLPRTVDTFFNWMGIPQSPYSGCTYSVVDFLWLHEWIDAAYSPQRDHFYFPWKPLSVRRYCTGSFTRYDQEVVATAVASSHNCPL